jgi:hypothetical protein
MLRFKTLLFQSFQLFREWYMSITTRISTVLLKQVQHNPLQKGVFCTISY